MRASAPPAAISAAPMANTVQPRRRRSVEMPETTLRTLLLSPRERSRFVSCTMEDLSLNCVDHKVRYAPSRHTKGAAPNDDSAHEQRRNRNSSLQGGGCPEIFNRDLRDRQIV